MVDEIAHLQKLASFVDAALAEAGYPHAGTKLELLEGVIGEVNAHYAVTTFLHVPEKATAKALAVVLRSDLKNLETGEELHIGFP